VFRDKSGYEGADIAEYGQPGSNGLTVDAQGRLTINQHGHRRVVRLETNGQLTVLADRYEGKRFNRPNDLAIKSNGAIYITDPRGNNRPGLELDFAGVYLIKDGKVTLLEKDYSPNGITFSPDEKYLYVNGGGKVYRYDVRPDDTLANRREFIDMTADKTPGGTDGMKVDMRGNVFSSGPGGVWIISPEGKHLGTILAPEGGGVTNMAFGDADGKTLYLTVRRTLARIRLNTTGYRPNS